VSRNKRQGQPSCRVTCRKRKELSEEGVFAMREAVNGLAVSPGEGLEKNPSVPRQNVPKGIASEQLTRLRNRVNSRGREIGGIVKNEGVCLGEKRGGRANHV